MDKKHKEIIESAQEMIQTEIKEIKLLSKKIGSSFVSAILSIEKCIIEKRKVIVVGVGKSGDIGHKISTTFCSIGIPSVLLNAQNALHGDIGMIVEDDVILIISNSGETEEILNILPSLKALDITIICMTGKMESTLAQNSDIVLDISVTREAESFNLVPTCSTTVTLVLGDMLALALLRLRGFTRDDYAKFHPKGSIGKNLLTKVLHIMRKGTKVAFVTPNDSVETTLTQMTKSKSGAAIVVNNKGKLEGIFTHGDFVRAFQKDPFLAKKEIINYTTKNPVSISSKKLATEALSLFEKNKVDDIVVLDDNNKPVGIIDSQDLTKL